MLRRRRLALQRGGGSGNAVARLAQGPVAPAIQGTARRISLAPVEIIDHLRDINPQPEPAIKMSRLLASQSKGRAGNAG